MQTEYFKNHYEKYMQTHYAEEDNNEQQNESVLIKLKGAYEHIKGMIKSKFPRRDEEVADESQGIPNVKVCSLEQVRLKLNIKAPS